MLMRYINTNTITNTNTNNIDIYKSIIILNEYVAERQRERERGKEWRVILDVNCKQLLVKQGAKKINRNVAKGTKKK